MSSADIRSPRLAIILATRSEGKRRELESLLGSALPAAHTAHGIEVLTLDDLGFAWTAEEDVIESFATFEENALAKARWFASRMTPSTDEATASTFTRPSDLRWMVLADDSGLSVDALDGAPGVHSKRWAGHASLDGAALAGDALDAANNASLLRAVADANASGVASRAARYVCAAAAVWPTGHLVVRGETHGTLLHAPRGAGGFGYDPYFWSTDLGATFAEVSREEKARVSHRGRAFRAVFSALDARGVWLEMLREDGASS